MSTEKCRYCDVDLIEVRSTCPKCGGPTKPPVSPHFRERQLFFIFVGLLLSLLCWVFLSRAELLDDPPAPPFYIMLSWFFVAVGGLFAIYNFVKLLRGK